MRINPIPPTLLTCRILPAADVALLRSLNAEIGRHTSLALMTCDQDDSLYVALDEATKHADVDVVFAQSMYAGSAHSSGPLSGEILGVLAAPNPDELQEAIRALARSLEEDICFYQPHGGGPSFFPHVIAQTGRYLSKEANVPEGTPMAYLIAPPIESMIGLDAALKAADVRLAKHFPPPSPTNFGGGYLVGELPAVEAAARAFVEAILDVAASPRRAFQRDSHERR